MDETTSPLSYAVIGALLEVRKVLGGGFLEAVYQHAVASEMRKRGIPFRREVALPVHYKDEVLPVSYRADFVCGTGLLLELKAQTNIGDVEDAQVINYLRATGVAVAILANFGPKRLDFRRLVVARDATGNDVVDVTTI